MTPLAPSPRPASPSRGRWPLRDYPSLFWLMAALLVAVLGRQLPSSRWLLVHLVLLGALSHAILVWSNYFAQALLKSPAATSRTDQNLRITALLVGSSAVFVGVPTGWWPLTVAGATLVGIAVGWHALALGRMLRAALPGRFRISLHYYLAAAGALLVGATLGAILARVPADPWHGQLLLAHTMANLLGWAGFTLLGTLVTFWPTILRTKIDPRADRLAKQALPVLIAGLAVVITGALVAQPWLALAGLAGYGAGALWWGRALVAPLRTKPPREFASAAVGLALVWALLGLGVVAWLLIRGQGWAAITAGYAPVAAIFAVGVGAQLLTGALSYLFPAVLGGGPAAARATLAWFNKAGTLRLVLVNAGLTLYLAPTPPMVRAAAAAIGLAGLAGFLIVLVGGLQANLQARRPASDAVDAAPAPAAVKNPASFWSSGQLVAALTAVSLAVALGVGIDPAAAGLPRIAPGVPAASASATGEVVRVEVRAQGMSFVPNQVTINPGDQLIIRLFNDDPTTAHDLSIGGLATPRLLPDTSAELDLGVVTESIQGWCTIAGHRQAGMVFDVLVAGQDAASPEASEPTDHGGHGSGVVPSNPDAELAAPINPLLAPLGESRVHEITLTVTEEPLEVAPGVWQQRWTFNGASVGPTLHGRVGDRFIVTLVNEGTMGHSIDFHAGEVAPDEPMRTIPPGESLVYEFTANRAGIWMYHCSTPPMSSHISAGMHGAVVIEPEGLPQVDRSYVLVQSEVYLANLALTADQATEVAADRIAGKDPDLVVFNGIANQYDHFPFEARVGERVRFWVLAAGPNVSSSFHIVGGQFDTLYFEGGYQLNRGTDAFGNSGGGSQALGLLPAQGGFVELTFPEAGHYPVVSHIMSDAERGAHGIVRVLD